VIAARNCRQTLAGLKSFLCECPSIAIALSAAPGAVSPFLLSGWGKEVAAMELLAPQREWVEDLANIDQGTR
jgi:hypothetical protein